MIQVCQRYIWDVAYLLCKLLLVRSVKWKSDWQVSYYRFGYFCFRGLCTCALLKLQFEISRELAAIVLAVLDMIGCSHL